MSREPFVTADDVAQHLKIARRQVLEMARKHFLPAHPVCLGTGRRIWRFKLSEVDEAVVCRTAPPGTSATATCNTMSIGSPRSRRETQ